MLKFVDLMLTRSAYQILHVYIIRIADCRDGFEKQNTSGVII
jgi:hypothetical protein